jgi:transcriptional regulator with XRE-family HTH domain
VAFGSDEICVDAAIIERRGEAMSSHLSDQAGLAVRKLRLAKGWTLSQLSDKSGVPLSTLSKLELGQVSLSYEKLVRLCRALDVDLERFVRNEVDHAPATAGRRAVTRAGTGEPALFGAHRAELAASDLLSKAFSPAILEIGASDLADHGPLRTQGGDVYLHVLDGSVVLHTEIYAPLALAAGDAIYFDGRTAHAAVAGEGGRARVLMVAAGPDLNRG